MPDRDPNAMIGPKEGCDTTDRLLDCECDIEQSFLVLMNSAVAAGWTRAEAAVAVTSLADNYLLSRVAHARIAQDIRNAVANIKKG